MAKWRFDFFSPLSSVVSVIRNWTQRSWMLNLAYLRTTERFVCFMLENRILQKPLTKKHFCEGKWQGWSAGQEPPFICGGWCLLGCTEAALSSNWWWASQHLPTGTAVTRVQSKTHCTACPGKRLLMPLQHSAGWDGDSKLLLHLEKLFCISTPLPYPFFFFSIQSTNYLNKPKEVCVDSWEERRMRGTGDLDGVSQDPYLLKGCQSLDAVVPRFSWQNCWLCYAWFKSCASIARPNKQSLISPQNTAV